MAANFRYSPVMRHHSVLRRALTALFGLWFTVLVTEPRAVHACPMHDGVPVAASRAAAGAAHSSHHSMTEMAVEPTELAAHSAPVPTEHAGHECLCLGCCCTTPAVAPLVPASLAWLTQILDVAPRLESRGTIIGRPERVAFALPFGNGPPTA